MDVKPWEPVGGWWMFIDEDNSSLTDHAWSLNQSSNECEWAGGGWADPLLVTLANNQKIIVRALSEDRKAARAVMKEANR